MMCVLDTLCDDVPTLAPLSIDVACHLCNSAMPLPVCPSTALLISWSTQACDVCPARQDRQFPRQLVPFQPDAQGNSTLNPSTWPPVPCAASWPVSACSNQVRADCCGRVVAAVYASATKLLENDGNVRVESIDCEAHDTLRDARRTQCPVGMRCLLRHPLR